MENPKEYEINRIIERIREFKKKVEKDFSTYLPVDYWGMCPQCFENGEELQGVTLNVGRNHYECCHKHQVFWHTGSNLFSNWHDESEEVWSRNEELLQTYTEVKPLTISHLFNLFQLENLEREKAEMKKMLKEKAGIDIDAVRAAHMRTSDAQEPF